ncbi:MAG TPA: YceI family protein [Desertimonas sp.]|nr:YceI family protein [Desertimonas sp.]
MNRIVKILLVATVVLVAVAGAGIWWFLRDDAPAAVSLETAVESVDDTAPAASESTASSTSAAESATTQGVDGNWTVDTETGEFDYEGATGTFAGFRIQEELASIGSATAVGRTGAVTGTITIEGDALVAAEFSVDLSTITTNESRRDDRVQSALETGQFPTATFTLTEPVSLGAAATTGDAVSVSAVGDLAIHGVTNQVTFALDAQLVGDTIVVVGSTDILFSDYSVQVPDSQVVLSVEDHGVVEMQLLLVRAA